MKLFLLDPSEHYTERLIAASFVPETMAALELLKLFLTHPQGMAVVVDEFGATRGMVTLEYVLVDLEDQLATALDDISATRRRIQQLTASGLDWGEERA